MITTQEATVFVVDSDLLIRKTVSSLADSIGLPAREFAAAGEFLQAYDPHLRGCLVLDFHLPDMSGLQLFECLASRHGYCPAAVVVTADGDIQAAIAAVRAGVIDFIEMPFDPGLLAEQMQKAVKADCEAYRRHEQREKLDGVCRSLSERERQVIAMLLLGKPNKQIAAELNLSFKTISWHRVTALKKLGVDSILELVGQNYPDLLAHFRPRPVGNAA